MYLSRFVISPALLAQLIVCQLVIIVATSQALASQEGWPEADEVGKGRTIVLGFDGMDPKLAQLWMDSGALPNFKRLAERGSFQPLPTTNPAQSPVAWASFATGSNPGAHGLFDFLRRNPQTYEPEYALASTEDGRQLELFGLRIPLTGGSIVNRREGQPFWGAAEAAGFRASVLRVPVTYPPDDISRMLSGMGVPDLLGTQGTFTIYSTRDLEGENARTVKVLPENGRVETDFEGPAHPLKQGAEALTVPLSIEARGPSGVHITLDGTELALATGDWSDWIPLRFSVGWVVGIRAMVRLHLVSAFPNLQLYVSPINLDPRDPVSAISSPPGYAKELAERIGLYHTIGMPEETWSLNEGMISDGAYLDMVRTVLAEREKMLFDALEQNESDLVVVVFVQTDRVSHMFFRGIDSEHPLFNATGTAARGAIEWIYRESDRILGETMDRLTPDDRLIVLSDHGFSSFRRSVHLNRWLVEQGFMTLKAGQPQSDSLFTNVDWTRTRAYAIGLNGIYLNLADRERLGVVRADQAKSLKDDLSAKLRDFVDPETGASVVANVYLSEDIYQGSEAYDAPDLVIGYSEGYRASWQTALGGVPTPLLQDNDRKWSGDHCIDPVKVPGVLFTSFVPDAKVNSIADLPSLIQHSFSSSGKMADVARH
jgi:predicted AlkP superfamily phosphohydrolase/phosphomutase